MDLENTPNGPNCCWAYSEKETVWKWSGFKGGRWRGALRKLMGFKSRIVLIQWVPWCPALSNWEMESALWEYNVNIIKLPTVNWSFLFRKVLKKPQPCGVVIMSKPGVGAATVIGNQCSRGKGKGLPYRVQHRSSRKEKRFLKISWDENGILKSSSTNLNNSGINATVNHCWYNLSLEASWVF